MSRKLLAVALLAGLTATVGNAAPPAGAAETRSPAAAVTPAGSAVRAERIAFVRTGGLQGGTYSFSFSGTGNSNGARALQLASTRAFQALRPRYVPRNTCCDRYLYKIEVRYANGRTKRVTALEGTPGIPQVLLDVIRLIETMPTPKPPTVKIPFPPGFPFS